MNGRIQKFDFEKEQSTVYDDILSALLWNKNQAPNLIGLITKKAEWFDKNYRKFWKNWFHDVFNLRTCNDFGITLWSIILDLPLQIGTGRDPAGKPIWGFGSETGAWKAGDYRNFGNGNFSNIENSQLSFGEKKFLLLLRVFQLQCRGAIPEINTFLQTIVGEISDSGTIYAVDNLDMTMTYFFSFNPREVLLRALEKFDVFPRPTGVGLRIKQPIKKPTFGFGPDTGAWGKGYASNFDNSTFF